MRVLITGARGQLGHEVVAAAADCGFDAVGVARNQLDITDAGRVDRIFKKKQPDLVVNCAAYTAVDRAEEEMERALAVNRDGPANLATACSSRSVPLVHVSTDYVFDGTQEAPYTEADPVRPINAYGSSKLAGEQAVAQRTGRFVILRTAWVFGTHGHNFVKTMLQLAMERESHRRALSPWISFPLLSTQTIRQSTTSRCQKVFINNSYRSPKRTI